MILNAFPDSRAQQESLQRLLKEKIDRIADLEEELRVERIKTSGLEVGAAHLRATLEPLYHALQLVFGHIDAMGVRDYAPTPGSAAPISDVKRQAWDSWKHKMGGAAAKIIDLLMVHGELNQEQMRIHIGTKRMQTVYDATSKLKRADLIVKNGDKFSLKEL